MRKTEILNAAEELFNSLGYEKCTVNDILNKVGIAKGTFYHYLKSKEEVLDEIVVRYHELIIEKVEVIRARTDLTSPEKLLHAFLAMQIEDQIGAHILDEMHKPDNALLHYKTLDKVAREFAPILVGIIEEGVGNAIWKCKYPLEYMQIFLISAISLTDSSFFLDDPESQAKNLQALISLLEKMLDAPENSFLKMYLENV